MVSFLFHNNEQLCKSGLSFLPHGDSLPENKVNPEESKLRYNISENIWTLHLMSDLSMYRQDITTNEFFFFFFCLKYLKLILFIFIMSMLHGRFSQANCKNQVTLLNMNCISLTVEWWEGAWGWDRALQLKYAVLGSLMQTVWEREYERQHRSTSRYNGTNLYIHTPFISYPTTQFVFQNIKNFSLLSWPLEWIQKELSNLSSKLQIKNILGISGTWQI